jgi:hypothetical protein
MWLENNFGLLDCIYMGGGGLRKVIVEEIWLSINAASICGTVSATSPNSTYRLRISQENEIG